MSELLLSGRDLSVSYGARALFEHVSLSIEAADRVAVIGPNGAGKTTLLRVLAGDLEPDCGEVIRRRGVRLAHVPQVSRFDCDLTVRQVVSAAAVIDDPAWVEEDFERDVRVSIVLEQAGLVHAEARVGTLSGGWKKRLAIAEALAQKPHVLLLDEPTNHLDLEGILWLEKMLGDASFACLVISHDRAFIESVAESVIEVATYYPDGFFRAPGAYSDFLRRRDEYLAGRAQYRASIANRVRRELEWLGRGPKARTSKAQARVEQAERLQQELATLRAEAPGPGADIELTASGRKTRRLLVASGLEKSIGGRCLFRNLELMLRPGLRLGLVGANGSGKSTLLKVLAGRLGADAGWIRRADNLKTVYFDQHREQLDDSLSLRRALAEHADQVIYRDRPVHVVSWAHRFQFRTEQLDLPISELSGGELARVHIARLVLRPADLLLLDEPTNDLDIQTLEILEESLADFPGALILVTHDRMLLDRVANLLIGLAGDGTATYFADVAQWTESIGRAFGGGAMESRRPSGGRPRTGASRLTYLEQKEYEGMEAVILEAESEVEAASKVLDDPEIAADADRLQAAFEMHRAAQARVQSLYERWSELEDKLSS